MNDVKNLTLTIEKGSFILKAMSKWVHNTRSIKVKVVKRFSLLSLKIKVGLSYTLKGWMRSDGTMTGKVFFFIPHAIGFACRHVCMICVEKEPFVLQKSFLNEKKSINKSMLLKCVTRMSQRDISKKDELLLLLCMNPNIIEYEANK